MGALSSSRRASRVGKAKGKPIDLPPSGRQPVDSYVPCWKDFGDLKDTEVVIPTSSPPTGLLACAENTAGIMTVDYRQPIHVGTPIVPVHLLLFPCLRQLVPLR